jgi:hypothetical protein
MRTESDRTFPQAVFEVLLGLLVAMAALVPLVFIVAGRMELSDKGFSWVDTLFVIAAIPVLAWCVQTSWRLFTGRPRKDGGLLSPGVIAVAGFGLAALGLYGMTRNGWHGWRALPTAGLFVMSGVSTVLLAWNGVRRRRRWAA